METEKKHTTRREEDQTMVANRREEDQTMVDERRAYDRRMEDRVPNAWKIVSLFGIPLTAILTWVFVAGGIVQDVKTNTREIEALKTTYAQLDTRIRTVELGIVRIETQYQQIIDTLNDIKNTLKAK